MNGFRYTFPCVSELYRLCAMVRHIFCCNQLAKSLLIALSSDSSSDDDDSVFGDNQSRGGSRHGLQLQPGNSRHGNVPQRHPSDSSPGSSGSHGLPQQRASGAIYANVSIPGGDTPPSQASSRGELDVLQGARPHRECP